VIVTTPGDLSSDPVEKIGVGVFTSALRDALANDEVDVAVHSYKDLPTAPDDRLSMPAVPPREDARDALVARDGLVLGELPAGSVV
ncbi:hydroxymethylbilane synthase, partial [Mycobacterium kansasii]